MNEEFDIIEYLRENGYDVGCEYAEVPVLGTVSCGTPDWDTNPDTEDVPTALLRDGQFHLRARGRSMVGWGIKEGDLLEFQMRQTAESQEVVLAVIAGEATLKTYFVDPKGHRWLLPGNDAYRPICLDNDPSVGFQGVLTSRTSCCNHVSYYDCINILDRAGISTSRKYAETQKQADYRESFEEKVIRVLRPLLIEEFKDAALVQEKRDFAAIHRLLVERFDGKLSYRSFTSILQRARLPMALLPSEDSVRKVAFVGKFPNWRLVDETSETADRLIAFASIFNDRMQA